MILINLLPKEKIVSCCKSNKKDIIYLISKKGSFFKLNIDEIYNAHDSKLGYINEKIQLKNDQFLKITSNNQYIIIETNKNKSARLNLNKLPCESGKNKLKIDFLNLEKDEYIENCSRLEIL